MILSANYTYIGLCMGNGLVKLHYDTSILLTWGTYIGTTNSKFWHCFTLLDNGTYYFYTLDNVLVLICKWFLSAFTSKSFCTYMVLFTVLLSH